MMLYFEKLSRKMGRLPEHVLAGFSGGCDSTALVLLMLKKGVKMSCVHVHHGLRDMEADADEAFVREFCNRHSIPLYVYHAVPPAHPSEGWAREARYSFFREAMHESGAEVLALAHHADDQAETMLLHLLRGSGLDGLCGMRRSSQMYGMQILRPLLECTHEELKTFLQEEGQPWCEDSTNAEDQYLRNQVRHQLIPVMETMAPGCVMRMAHTCRILQDDADLLADMMETAEPWMGKREIPLSILSSSRPLRSRFLRAWWESMAGVRKEKVLNFEKTEELLALVDQGVGAACNLPGSLRAVRGYRYLHMLDASVHKDESQWQLADGLKAFGVTFEVRACTDLPGDGKRNQAVPEEWLKGLTVRTRRSGDWIRPFGQSGKQPLKEYLIDRRVDQPFRDRIPLICRGSEVVVCCGVGSGGIPRMPKGAGTTFGFIRWHGDMPWLSEEKEQE